MIRYIKEDQAGPTTLEALIDCIRAFMEIAIPNTGQTLPELCRLMRGPKANGAFIRFVCTSTDIADVLRLFIRTGEARVICRETKGKAELAFVLQRVQVEGPAGDKTLMIRIDRALRDANNPVPLPRLVEKLRRDGGDPFALGALGWALNELIVVGWLELLATEPSATVAKTKPEWSDVQLYLGHTDVRL